MEAQRCQKVCPMPQEKTAGTSTYPSPAQDYASSDQTRMYLTQSQEPQGTHWTPARARTSAGR